MPRPDRHPFFDVPHPSVIGHRGAAGSHPENTLASFAAALEQGADILESDVHVTRDGVPILLHDPDVERVSEGRGLAATLDFDAIARLDAGHRFQDGDGGFPHRDRGHRIPSLEAAFEVFPEARFNLELKTPDPAAIEATLDLVERYGRDDRTLLVGGEDAVMKPLREALARRRIRPATGACLGEILAAIRSALGQGPMPEAVMALQIPATFGGAPLVTRELVDHAHATGVEVHVWTINDLEESARLLELGVDGLVTDWPGRLHAWLERNVRGTDDQRPR